MKKIFSLFMVAAIVLTMSFAAMAADPVSGMKFLITETDSDITVSVIIGNFVNLNGFQASLATTAVTYVDGSVSLKLNMENNKETLKSGIIQFAPSTTDTSKYLTNAGDVEALTFKVVKVDESKELSAADFAHATATLNYSQMTCDASGNICGVANPGKNFTNKKQDAAYFTVEYVDERTPVGGGEGGDSTPVYSATKEEVVTEGWTAEFKYPTDTNNGTSSAAVGKKVTAFGKNGGTEALTAGNYGIKIGNRFYPGRRDVPAGSYFAIIIVNSNGDEAIKDSYSYQIYLGNVDGGNEANAVFQGEALTALAE